MIKKKRTKTQDRLLAISKTESDAIGIKVFSLRRNELNYIVNMYVLRYRQACLNIYGWDEDDLKQHIAQILWKGVATFNTEKNVKITTYLSAILHHQMANLSKSLQRKKRYIKTQLTEEAIKQAEEAVEETTTEDWIIYRNKFSNLMGQISKKETSVLVLYLINGMSVDQMKEELKIPRTEVVSILKTIDSKLKEVLG